MTRPRTSPRLRPEDWLSAGLSALAASGPAALAAEPLARRLGTTKGSFYWHFADLPAYHAAILTAWEDASSARLPADQAGNTVARLRLMAQELATPAAGAATDRAVRAWALSHPGAAAAVERTDTAIGDYLRALLADVGIGNPEMARLIQATGIGMADLGGVTPQEAARTMGSLVDLVLALR